MFEGKLSNVSSPTRVVKYDVKIKNKKSFFFITNQMALICLVKMLLALVLQASVHPRFYLIICAKMYHCVIKQILKS